MERLCDLRGRRLVVECPPCKRRGTYNLARSRQRFGDHAGLSDVYPRLTQAYRYQKPVGSREPNQFGQTCRAAIGVEGGDGRRSLPSRT
ncbi:hypothetical protein AFCDBAGC_4071 [Methylobacterium cerastii]|uniref:Transposase n=1 Tax=Methylobacterium cerastii TaxID=932741 RepID=A0ABQ4QNA2_9HYPH|nr:hypothetical protein FV219_05955 [Methylobacterium sp. WL122]TXN82777.1 hypothetical protein FV234_08780 [Methylobacterium sp. WL8]GJD46191.1 hypothetical protein AFCDBAGC_4071 [Methylobacterium cerastii]